MLASSSQLKLSEFDGIYDRLIPANFLRKFHELVDFSFIYEELEDKYCLENGHQDNKRAYQDTLKAIENMLFDTYGCLLPFDEVSVTLTLPWTKESMLGELKCRGEILSWEQDKTYEDGNNRRYHITLDAGRV